MRRSAGTARLRTTSDPGASTRLFSERVRTWLPAVRCHYEARSPLQPRGLTSLRFVFALLAILFSFLFGGRRNALKWRLELTVAERDAKRPGGLHRGASRIDGGELDRV